MNNKFNANFGITPKNNSNFSNSFKPNMGGQGNLGQMNKGGIQNKYSFSELEDAKNALKGLGGLKKFPGIGSNRDNLGGGNNSNVLNTGGNINSESSNYRKAFKPNLNGNGNHNTNNINSTNNLNNIYSNTMNTGNKTIKSNVMQQENFLVEKKTNMNRQDNNQHHPNLLGIGNNNKPMINSKYGSGMGNTNTSNSIGKQGGGSYTNSKLHGNKFTSDFNNFNKQQNEVNNFQNTGKRNNMNSNYMQQDDMYGGKSKNNQRNDDYNYMNSTQNVNSNNNYNNNNNNNMVKQNMNKTGFVDVDNMVAQNTQR
jgi:CCR4-NOT transcription complex subunit 7/8